MPDTIITGGGDSGAGGVIAAIVLGIVLVLGALWLFNSGAFNTGGGSSVTVEAPTIEVPAPATPAPAN
jgi:hypothetical protein